MIFFKNYSFWNQTLHIIHEDLVCSHQWLLFLNQKWKGSYSILSLYCTCHSNITNCTIVSVCFWCHWLCNTPIWPQLIVLYVPLLTWVKFKHVLLLLLNAYKVHLVYMKRFSQPYLTFMTFFVVVCITFKRFQGDFMKITGVIVMLTQVKACVKSFVDLGKSKGHHLFLS